MAITSTSVESLLKWLFSKFGDFFQTQPAVAFMTQKLFSMSLKDPEPFEEQH